MQMYWKEQNSKCKYPAGGLNAGETVPIWKFNSSSNLIIDPYCRNKRAGQESTILEPHKHTCFAHPGISKQHNLREKLTSLI